MDNNRIKMDKDMSFLRDYFRIPAHVGTCWVIINDERNKRLGLELINTDKVIDVADACFRQLSQGLKVKPVRHVVKSDCEEFISDDSDKLSVPKGYTRKLYFRRIFSPELLETPLL